MNFGSFAAGAAEAGSADIQKRRDLSFELKLRNRVAELQLSNAMQLQSEEEAQSKRKFEREGYASEDALGALGKLRPELGDPGELKNGEWKSLLPRDKAGAGGRGFAGDRPLSAYQKKSLLGAGVPLKIIEGSEKEGIAGMTRSDMQEYNILPNRQALEDANRFLSAAPNLKGLKKIVKETFGKDAGKMEKLRGTISQLSDSELAKMLSPELSSLQGKLQAALGPAYIGKAQTVTEVKNLRMLLGKFYESDASLDRTLENLTDMIMEEHLRTPINSGMMGASRGQMVERYNKIAGDLGVRKMGKYAPNFADMDEEGNKQNEEFLRKAREFFKRQ